MDAAITSTPGQKVVFGVSQSALIVNEEKQQLLTDPNAPPPSQLSFVVEGNPARPNGGLFTRFPWLSSIPFVGIGPTTASPDSPYDTIDVAAQYDMAADFPKYPLNVVADVNAVMGFFSLHPNYTSLSTQQHPNLSTLTPVAKVTNAKGGTTTYYLVPTPNLPLLQPLRDAGVPSRIVNRLNTLLTPVVEAGYDRRPSQVGVSTPVRALPPPRAMVSTIKKEVAAIRSILPKKPTTASAPRKRDDEERRGALVQGSRASSGDRSRDGQASQPDSR